MRLQKSSEALDVITTNTKTHLLTSLPLCGGAVVRTVASQQGGLGLESSCPFVQVEV